MQLIYQALFVIVKSHSIGTYFENALDCGIFLPAIESDYGQKKETP